MFDNAGIFKIFLDESECFDPSQEKETLREKAYHLISHELGHKKSHLTEAYANYRHQIVENTNIYDEQAVALDNDAEATVEDIKIDARKSQEDNRFYRGFIYNNIISTVTDALKLSQMQIKELEEGFKLQGIKKMQFYQLVLRIVRRAEVARRINEIASLPNELQRYADNMKRQLDEYLLNKTLRYPELRDKLLKIKKEARKLSKNPEELGKKGVKNNLKSELEKLQNRIEFEGESPDRVELYQGSFPELRQGNLDESRFPLSRRMIDEIKAEGLPS